MDKRKQEFVKVVILVGLYLLLLPVILIAFKLLPYIIANDITIELGAFVTGILKNPIPSLLEIVHSTYRLPFFIVQMLVFISLFVFLHPTKRQPFEVVGKTNPVHGSAYWGEQEELDTSTKVQLIPESAMKQRLKKSMRRARNE